MSKFIRHILLITQFELKRLFASRKGILSLLTFAAIWLLILFYPIRLSANFIDPNYQAQSSLLLNFLGLGSLLTWPAIELQVYWRTALVLLPMLSIIIAADQTSSDRKRGTLRFLSLRTSRDNLFFGRFSAIVFIQVLTILITLISTLLLLLYRDSSLFSQVLNSSVSIFINLLIIILPFSALMAALSALFDSARQTIMWAILFLIVSSIIINKVTGYLPGLAFLHIFIPRLHSKEIASISGLMPLNIAYIPLLQTVVFLVLGRWVMMRKSL